MKVVVAVSGGVDSVVLLDMIIRKKVAIPQNLNSKEPFSGIVVAHFDHGMREGSVADARFVKGLADRYGLVFESKREELVGASEELARNRRYEFLFEVASRHQAKLVTAHHMDDVVETVALNISRGTRWRGLAGMGDGRIWRPLTKRTKSELIDYAMGERLEWVEDETNQQPIYARNRLRQKLAHLPRSEWLRVYELWQRQQVLRAEIGREIEQRHFPVLNRYFMTMIAPEVSKELLYEHILAEHSVSLLGSQLDYLLRAIKVGRAGTTWQIGQGVSVHLSLREWCVKMSK